MSDKNSKPSKLHRLLKGVEQISQIGKKVWAHPRIKAVFHQLWTHRLMVGLILLVILLVGGAVGVILDYKKSPVEVVEEFQKAIISRDVEKLQKLVQSNHVQLSFGPREANDLIRFAQEEDDFLIMLNALYSQASALESESVASVPKEQLMKYPYYLGQKSGFLGKTYTIRVLPRYLVIHADQPGAIVTLDGKKVMMKGKETKVGPFLPKVMKLKGVKKSPFSIVEDEQEVNLIHSSKEVVNEYLHLQGKKIKITSELPGTEILINGRKIGKQVGKEGFEFGPVSLNGQFKLSGQKKVPWGILKSKEQVIKEPLLKFDITPNPFLDATTKKQLIQTINTYARERVEAMKQVSTQPYTTIDELYKSKLEDDFENKRKYNSDEQYKGEAIKTVIDVKEGFVTLAHKTDQLKVIVPVRFHYRERTYDRTVRKDEPLKENNEEAYVWLIYDEKQKKWLISALNTIFYSGDLFRDPSCVITKLS